jgi:predicted membrane-bound dolichyl-phosphate-mannose-protein mannosyltransferase
LGYGGLAGYFFTVKSIDNPKNVWLVPSIYFLLFILPIAAISVELGLFTWIVGSMAVLKWSLTEKPYMPNTAHR